MTKKIISVLLACLIILPTAFIPAFAIEGTTYNLSELESSDVLNPGDVIAWEDAKYLSVTYITNSDPFSYDEDASFAAPVSNSGSLTVSDGSIFTTPNEKLSFGGWKVESINIKSSGVSEITLSAVWSGNGWDYFVYLLGCLLISFISQWVRIYFELKST